jgi:hypothetical protein
MKSKSKLKKIREGRTGDPKVPGEWLYLAPAGCTMRQIYELFGEGSPWKAEYWEEAGVLEIELTEAGSVDVETMEPDPGDEALRAYMEEEQAETVFAVTILPGEYEQACQVMKKIMESLGGIFCGDTEDFQPKVR